MNNTTLSIKTTKAPASKIAQVDFSKLTFGTTFTDHMFVADYIDGAWTNLEIVPYGNISISPASAVLHYGQEIFEGMKAYKFANGEISLFRPLKNHQRFNKSAVRMSMPEIPEEIFMQGILQLVQLDAAWVPSAENHALYLRPYMFANDPFLGVKPSGHYKFMVIACPVGPFFSKPLKVKIESTYTRADDGGVGFAKTGGNYARSLYPMAMAQKEGFDQLIWTDAQTHSFVEESGAANLMFVMDNKVVTPTVRGSVLDGITRDSVLHLAQHLGYTVEERRVPIAEVLENIGNGKLTEAFAVGTAATLTQIGSIGHEGHLLELNDVNNRPISIHIAQVLNNMRCGNTEDVFNWNVKVM